MSIKLEAQNEEVIAYLESLWMSSNPIIQEQLEEKKDENIIQPENIVVDTDNKVLEEQPAKQPAKQQFTKKVRDNLQALRDVGFRVYHNIGLEKEVNLQTKTVSNEDVNKVYDYKVGTIFTRKQLMTNICKTTIFPKYKSGDTKNPASFRYLVNHNNTIKILDRMWVLDVITKCGNNVPDSEIYKSNLVKNFSPNIIHTAIKNTECRESVVLLDITRAFDSLEWVVLEELLLANLTRKTNADTAKELVSHYMIILKNRELYYNNIIVKISKGIPTGLPSSNLVFTLALEEIIYRWMTKQNYVNNVDFMLNVYVDDIYLKIINLIKTKEIVYSLIDILAEYKLYVNKMKSTANENLDLTDIPNELKETDYYLGIPFTRNVKLYGELVLKEFQTKRFNWGWDKINEKLSEDDYSEEQSIVFGFMNYKLRPLMKTDGNVNKIILGKFINDTFVKPTPFKRMITCITSFFKSFF